MAVRFALFHGIGVSAGDFKLVGPKKNKPG